MKRTEKKARRHEGAALALLLVAPAAAQQAADVVGAVEKGLVRVAYTLRYDKGEAPYGMIWPSYHATSGQSYWKQLEDFVQEERPAERLGIVLSPTSVLTADPLIHPRFIERITVLAGDRGVAARPARWGTAERALVLELDAPLEAAQPLRFDAAASGPYLALRGAEIDGAWTYTTTSLSLHAARRPGGGGDFVPVSEESLILTEAGVPVTVAMDRSLAAADAWRRSPQEWSFIDAAALEQRVAALEATAASQIVRVALSFRSPAGDQGRRRFGYGGDEEEQATELTTSGVFLGAGRLLVLEELKPSVTARLERIRVHLANGDAVPASFVASLRDYGAFVAALEKPAPGGAGEAKARDILAYRDQLMFTAEVRVQGENRIAYHGHGRIHSFEVGWRRQVYPNVASDESALFLYDADGALAALPVARRTKVSEEAQWDSGEPVLTPTPYLRAVLDRLQENVDPGNVPLSEEEENRLAWLGVEMQPLNQDLARMQGVSDQTGDGETGALVIHVYSGSPAATAGLEAGDILLRLHVPGQPRPLEVEADEDTFGFGSGGYPWDRWDDLPEEYFDQVPPPWPPVDGALNRKLTDLGFGTPYTVEVIRGGQLAMRDFLVTQGPPHYDAARRAKSEDLGLTVRDLTYEVRRYFQLGPDEPGVIISKLEKGSKAAVAGLRPFELIISVDDRPIAGAAEFEEAIAAPGEHRLLMKRMTVGRLVKVKTG